MAAKAYRLLQVLLMIVGAGSFALFLNTLGTYSTRSENLTATADHNLSFRYGARQVYVSPAEGRMLFALSAISAGSGVALIVGGFFAPGIFGRRKSSGPGSDDKPK
ncbi:MAG: hypothetical protein WA459_09615 [Stellaceae bacterium]